MSELTDRMDREAIALLTAGYDERHLVVELTGREFLELRRLCMVDDPAVTTSHYRAVPIKVVRCRDGPMVKTRI